jgi:putative transposase
LQPETQPGLALSPWPVPPPCDWLRWVQAPQTEAELEALRRSLQRGAPYGSETWQKTTAKRLGLESTLRPRAATQSGSRMKKSCVPFFHLLFFGLH